MNPPSDPPETIETILDSLFIRATEMKADAKHHRELSEIAHWKSMGILECVEMIKTRANLK